MDNNVVKDEELNINQPINEEVPEIADMEESMDIIGDYEPIDSSVQPVDTMNQNVQTFEVPEMTQPVETQEVPVFENNSFEQPVQESVEPVMTPPVEPVAPVETQEVPVFENNSFEQPVEAPVEPVMTQPVEPVAPVEDNTVVGNYQSGNSQFNEHPDGKIVLNNQEDEEETDEKVNLADLKNSLKLSENTSLKFVLIIGVIILAAILLLPLTNKM